MTSSYQLLPEDLALLISQRPADFLSRYSDATFLAVNVGGASELLLPGLSALGAGSVQRVSVIAFKTVVSAGSDRQDPRRAIDHLRRKVEQARHFVIALGKRGDSTYADRISVGRALNKDIVLRDASISKFHAWFETANGEWTLTDAGSTNGTRVNGVALSARQTVALTTGDTIRFGSIECVLCTPGLLLQAFAHSA